MKAGDLLSFSVQGLHRDPNHWSHPEEFYPEHFSKEEKATRSPYAFQAFGQGNALIIYRKTRILILLFNRSKKLHWDEICPAGGQSGPSRCLSKVCHQSLPLFLRSTSSLQVYFPSWHQDKGAFEAGPKQPDSLAQGWHLG